MLWIMLLIGGFLGAIARQTIYAAIQERARVAFPIGILSVNLSGAFLLGLLASATPGDWARWLVVATQTGFVGAYTTYSTWAVDSTALLRSGRGWSAAANLGGSLAMGVLLARAGMAVGESI